MSDVLLFLSLLALALLLAERLLVSCARKHLAHVVHINGTRGKSAARRSTPATAPPVRRPKFPDAWGSV